jgi:hypothetical protein
VNAAGGTPGNPEGSGRELVIPAPDGGPVLLSVGGYPGIPGAGVLQWVTLHQPAQGKASALWYTAGSMGKPCTRIMVYRPPGPTGLGGMVLG